MMIKRSLSCILGLMLAVFLVSGSANAVVIPIGLVAPGESDIDSAILVNGDTVDNTYTFGPDVGIGESLGFNIDVGAFANEGGSGIALSYLLSTFDQGVIAFGTIANVLGGTNPVALFVKLAFDDTGSLLIGGTSVGNSTYSVELQAVPIPAAGILFGSALAGIAFLSRRRRKRQNTQAVI